MRQCMMQQTKLVAHAAYSLHKAELLDQAVQGKITIEGG